MQGLRRSLFLITLPLVTFGCLASIDTANGQIIPDNTLGAEKSVVNSNANTDRINGGARRGANLFHSFREFSVREGRAAFFSNPTGVENIFSRVTGDRRSNILGTLGVADNGNANLFFMNPNGIFFGEKARLDMRGSFLASTANSLLFDGGLEFSASNPQAPPMLAINIPIGLQFRDNPGRITNRSVADDVGLQVASGKTLSLVGGDVNLKGGQLTAAGGRIELGGLVKSGTVSFNSDGSLSFPDGVTRGDVSLKNGAEVVSLIEQKMKENGADVIINARSLSMSSNAILSTSTLGQGNSGNIQINATDSISVTSGSMLGAITTGSGNAGNIVIQAKDATVSFDGIGTAISTTPSGALLERQGFMGTGQGAGIKINARTFSVTNGAFLMAGTLGKGNSGNIQINATDSISVTNGSTLGAFTAGSGNAGNIVIEAGDSISVTSGSTLGAFTAGSGNAGNIVIEAKDATVSFHGIGTAVTTSVSGKLEIPGFQFVGTGQGGDITINARTLSVTNGTTLATSTLGQGNSGNIQINAADSISVTSGSKLEAFTSGSGKAGIITINNADTISFDGGGAFSTVKRGAEGDAGGIDISTKNLNLTNGAQLTASTFGKGNAGTIKINATDTVFFDGVSSNNYSSGVFSNVERGAEGDAGGIDISTKNLNLTNGAQLTASTFGKGNAGTVKIIDADAVSFDGVSSNGVSSGTFSNVERGAEGDAGGIDISTKNLNLTNGAQLTASTFGKGNAGTIKINATDTVFFDGVSSNNYSSGVFSNVERGAEGDAGGIDISTKNLNLTNGAQIAAGTFGKGNAGTIKINAADTISFDGVSSDGYSSGAFSNVEPGGVGNGGNIDIFARSLSLTNKAQINATSLGNGAAGNITATTKKDIRLDNQASIEANTVGGKGNITLKSRDLILRRNSNITTNARGSASGGNITIDTDNLIALENSDIKAQAEESYGGRVSITAQGIFGTKFRQQETSKSDITASSELGPEFSGQVTLNLPNVDPSHGLVELPKNVVDPTEQIAQNPCQRGLNSKFIITGRGGLPPSPNEATSSDTVQVDLVEPASGGSEGAGEQRSRGTEDKRKSSVAKPIMPAQGWILDKNGEVMLTAYDPTGTGSQRPLNSDVCPVP